MKTWPARSVWLGGGPETIAKSLTTRIRNPKATFPSVEAFLAALEGNVYHHFSSGPSVGMEKYLEGVVSLLRSLDGSTPFPVPLKIQVIVVELDEINMETWKPQFDFKLRVAPECAEVLRTYNRLQRLRMEEALYCLGGPVVVWQDAGNFQVDVPALAYGWDDDPLDLEH